MSTFNQTAEHYVEETVKADPPGWTYLGLTQGALERNWGWFVLMGALTLVAGLAAVVLPHIAALAVNLLLGAVLVIHGVLQGFHAFHMRGLKGFAWQALGALAAIVVGVLLIGYPIAGLVSLTLVVAAFLVVAGGLKIGMGVRLKPVRGWGWLVTNGALVAVLGALILVQWPEVSSWVLGLLVGIDMAFSGMWLILIGLSGRRLKST